MFEVVLDFFFLNQQNQQQWLVAHRVLTPRGSLGSPRSTTRSCMLTTSPTLVVLGRLSPSPCSLRSPFSPSLSFYLSVSHLPCPLRLSRVHRMHHRYSLHYAFSAPMERAAAFLRPRRFADRAAAARATL